MKLIDKYLYIFIGIVILFFLICISKSSSFGTEYYNACDKYAYPKGCETDPNSPCSWRY